MLVDGDMIVTPEQYARFFDEEGNGKDTAFAGAGLKDESQLLLLLLLLWGGGRGILGPYFLFLLKLRHFQMRCSITCHLLCALCDAVS